MSSLLLSTLLQRGAASDSAAVADSIAQALLQAESAAIVARTERIGLLVTIAVSAIIVMVFVYSTARYLWSLRRTSKSLNLAASEISGENDTPPRVFPKGPIRLQDLWGRFLRERKGTTRPFRGVQVSTLAPEEIFHEQAILDAYNRNFAVTLAGFFTGLGILGTFLGLIIGLTTVDMERPEFLMGTVGSLLQGMSTAFWTSLVGISFSLLWLFLDRVLYHDVQRAAGAFYRTVRRHYPVESADRLLHRLLTVEEEESAAIKESKVVLEEQKAILQDLSFDLATAFQDALQKSLGETLVPTLNTVAAKLDELSVHFGEKQVQAMQQMVASFQDRLSEQMHGQFEHLSGALKDAADWQHAVHGELERLVERVSEGTEATLQMIGKAREVTGSFNESIAGLTNAHEKIAASSEVLEMSSGRIAGVMEELSEGLEAQMAAIKSETEALAERIGELDRQQAAYREANEDIRTQLAQQIDAVEEQVASLTQFWTDFRNDLGGVGLHLSRSVEEFSVFTADKLKEIFARFDAEMATVVEHLSGTLAEVREVTEELPANIQALEKGITESLEPLGRAAASISALPSAIESLDGLTASVGRLAPLGPAVEGAAVTVAGTEKALTSLSSSVQSVDLRVGKLLESVQRWREQLKENGDAPAAGAVAAEVEGTE